MSAEPSWAARRLARCLDPGERDAVLGDLRELELPKWRQFAEVLGLLLRREAIRWRRWQPWLAAAATLAAIYHLGLGSRAISGTVAIHTSTFWYDGERYLSGLSATEEIAALAIRLAGLAFWAWTTGYLVGSLARRSAWLLGSLTVLVWAVFSATLIGRGVSGVLTSSLPPQTLARTLTPYIAMSATFFLLPPLAVLAPALQGAARGRRRGTETPFLAFIVAVLALALSALDVWGSTWHGKAVEAWSEGAIPARGINWPAALGRHVALACPTIYIVLTAMSDRARRIFLAPSSV